MYAVGVVTQNLPRLRFLVTSSSLKAALFRACGPGRRGFSGLNGDSVVGFQREGDPPLAVGGSPLLSGAAVRLLQAKASSGFPRFPPFLSSE